MNRKNEWVLKSDYDKLMEKYQRVDEQNQQFRKRLDLMHENATGHADYDQMNREDIIRAYEATLWLLKISDEAKMQFIDDNLELQKKLCDALTNREVNDGSNTDEPLKGPDA